MPERGTSHDEATPVVVLCECGMATPSQGALIAMAKEQLRTRRLAAVVVKDLCAAAATRDPRLGAATGTQPLLVLACRPRAVRWVLHAAGIDTGERSVDVVDLRRPMHVVDAQLASGLARATPGERREIAGRDGWVSWFPVVDRDRCQDCGQCASYCMFGVYSSTPTGAVTVTHPHGCKTNCPACARLCPSAAIIFPKHDEAPFDGSEIADEEAVRALTRHHTHTLLGQDPYAALAARRERVQLLRRAPTEPEAVP